jgi:hypothetical protein
LHNDWRLAAGNCGERYRWPGYSKLVSILNAIMRPGARTNFTGGWYSEFRSWLAQWLQHTATWTTYDRGYRDSPTSTHTLKRTLATIPGTCSSAGPHRGPVWSASLVMVRLERGYGRAGSAAYYMHQDATRLRYSWQDKYRGPGSGFSEPRRLSRCIFAMYLSTLAEDEYRVRILPKSWYLGYLT